MPRDGNGQALAYVYFEDEPGRRAVAKLLARDEARRIAANIAKDAGPRHSPVIVSGLSRYWRILAAIGRNSDNSSNRHLLRQYISVLREMLITADAPYVVAVVKEVGYALCKLAENPRHSARKRRNDVSQLARNVRHLRIAAGLTQGALAKRAGINRSQVSRLEAGHRKPTLDTLARLAKALQVTPRSLL